MRIVASSDVGCPGLVGGQINIFLNEPAFVAVFGLWQIVKLQRAAQTTVEIPASASITKADTAISSHLGTDVCGNDKDLPKNMLICESINGSERRINQQITVGNKEICKCSRTV